MAGDRRSRGTVANADPSSADVEELLRVAQDDLLLKLTVDVHTTTTSSSLDPDLSRRFDALRSHRAPPPPPPPKREPPSDGPSNPPGGGGGGGNATAAGANAAVDATRCGRSEGDEDEARKILGDDLAARFAALKGSSSSYLPAGSIALKPDRIAKEVDDADDDSGDDESDDDADDRVSKKEVEKLMQWAMDAARLDPDPGNSDDDEGVGKREEKGSDDDDDTVDEDDAAANAQEEEEKKTEKKMPTEGKKPPGRKWFMF